MKAQLIISTVALLATSLIAADAKDEVKAAAKKLTDSGYSWKATVESAGGGGGGGGGMRPGPTEGKVGKDGIICVKVTRGENTTEAFVKGENGAIKTDAGWQSLAEAAQSQGQGPGRFAGRMFRNYKAPAAQAEELAGKIEGLKKDGDVYGGALTEEGAKSLMTFGRGGGQGGGGAGPDIAGAKGTIKFWLKNGALSKYEYNVQGKVTFNNNEREINRTTTIEIKDVGTTKVDVPEEAKKKLM